MKRLIVCIAILANPLVASSQEVNEMTIRFENGTVSVACNDEPGGSDSAAASLLTSPMFWIAVVQVAISGADFAIRHGPSLIDEIQSIMDEIQGDHLILLDHEVAMLRGLFNQCVALTDEAPVQ